MSLKSLANSILEIRRHELIFQLTEHVCNIPPFPRQSCGECHSNTCAISITSPSESVFSSPGKLHHGAKWCESWEEGENKTLDIKWFEVRS